jgi:hypothetical protein
MKCYYILVLIIITLFAHTESNLKLAPDFDIDKIDYSPFKKLIEKIVNDTADIEIPTNSSHSLNCVMPKSSIMFTYTTHYLAEFISIQREAMNVWGLKDCLEMRFITVCIDRKCHDYCVANNIRNCVLINLPELPPSDFAKAAYHVITYLKHEFMFEALKVVNEIFFFDIDCLVLRNPWVDSRYGRDENDKNFIGNFDIQWQRDRGTIMNFNTFCIKFLLFLEEITIINYSYLSSIKKL